MATNKYNTLIAQACWGAKSLNEQKIVALTSQMETLKGDLKLSKDLIAKLRKSDPKKEVDGKKKNKETNMEHQKRDEKWNRTPPKAGEKHTKKHNKTTFHWCPHHVAWVMHKPAECRANPTHPEYKAPRSATPPPARTQVAHAAEIMDQLAALSIDLWWCMPGWITMTTWIISDSITPHTLDLPLSSLHCHNLVDDACLQDYSAPIPTSASTSYCQKTPKLSFRLLFSSSSKKEEEKAVIISSQRI